MRSNSWFALVLVVFPAALVFGCRGRQHAHVLTHEDPDMVGSHTGGAETWQPLIGDSMARLLGRHATEIVPVSAGGPPAPITSGYRRRICFIGVENRSIEEIGDFKEQIYEHIDTILAQSRVYAPVSRRFVDAALHETRLRPDELFLPKHRRTFATVIEEHDAPFDYLLFAKLTSGTTHSNEEDYQRDYTLTLEMVDVRTGIRDKESTTLRKGYHKSILGRWKHYGK